MSQSVVAGVKADLLAHPRANVPANLAGPCGAFAITNRVAWALRSEGWGLVASAANGCSQFGANYRADTLMKRDGTCKDILVRAESDNGDTSNPNNFNIPAWMDTGAQDPANWRAPFNADAGAEPGPDPGPDPVPPADNGEVITWLEAYEQREIERLLHLEGLIKQADAANERRYVDLVNRINATSQQISTMTFSGSIRIPYLGNTTIKLTQP